MEVLLVVALIAVVATLFVVSMESLGRTSPGEELEGAFWKAMAQAREKALTSRQPVEIRIDRDAGCFQLTGGSVAIPSGNWGQDTVWDVTFTEDLPVNDFILVRGQLVTRRPIPSVRVFPDGTCQTFSVEFTLGTAKHLVTIDPWTGAEMLGTGADAEGPHS